MLAPVRRKRGDAVPDNIGLGQGKYVMDYAREDEALPNFFLGLSYASGEERGASGSPSAWQVESDY